MTAVIFVLFVLARYHSPQLAGLTAFLAIFPGLVLSPLAGALLDRYGRARLVILDYLTAAASVLLIAGLSAAHHLPAAVLLVIVTVSSLTNPLSNAGARSLFPLLAPPSLWERANALDSGGYVVSTLVGSPVAGVLIGAAGPEWALAATGAIFVAAALVMVKLPEPGHARSTDGSLLLNAWLGLRYVARNTTLRGLAITLCIFNLAWGVLLIAVPVLVLGRLHGSAPDVGYLWGAMGAAGLVAALVAGRLPSAGRERLFIFWAIVASTVAMAVLPFARSIAVVGAAIVVVGAANGPFDIGLFTLRQRRTDPAWFGRAFAISMALNYVGQPVGSALAGPLIGASLDVALWTAVAISAASMLLTLLVIPASEGASRPG